MEHGFHFKQLCYNKNKKPMTQPTFNVQSVEKQTDRQHRKKSTFIISSETIPWSRGEKRRKKKKRGRKGGRLKVVEASQRCATDRKRTETSPESDDDGRDDLDRAEECRRQRITRSLISHRPPSTFTPILVQNTSTCTTMEP